MNKQRNKPTIDDVAKLAGVSASTVSRVVNRHTSPIPVSVEAISRVEAAMKELRYIPSAAARNLATQQTNTVGLIFSVFQGDFFGPLLAGIGQIVNDAGYELIISTAGGVRSRDELPVSLQSPNIDGLLIFSDALSDEGLVYAASFGPPAVLIHQSSPPNLLIT